MVCSIDSGDISTSSQIQMVDVTMVLQGAEETCGSVEVATLTDNNEPPNSETQPNKRSRKKSIVWEYFTIEAVGDDCSRAYCKQCKKSFAYISGSKLAGTSHLKRHISLGICPVGRLNQEKNQLSLYTPGTTNIDGSASVTELPRKHPPTTNIDGSARFTELPRKRYRGTPGSASIPFDQDRSRYDITKMIILHEYPLHIVEHPGFVDFVRTLQPQFSMVSFNTVQDDCVGLYLREKQSILDLLGGIPGRVSLTLDLWTSVQNLDYVILTGHFIDGDWKLRRRILNVTMVPYPDSEFAFNHAVAACVTNWSLDNKLFTLTLDQSFVSATVRENLRGLLAIKNPLILNGQLLIGNCFARVLSCIAQEALGSMSQTIRKVRGSVKYVKTSEAHEEKFVEVKQQLQVPSTESLVIDDQTKWNTTYRMLVTACELKEVFSCLDTSDLNYKETLSLNEWKKVETLCKYLKLLYDAANVLTATTYPTANMYFHEVWKIQIELMHAATSEDLYIRNLIRPLQQKFDRYWKDSCLVLAIAVIVDPRFKMKLVEFSFSSIYGEAAETWTKIVEEGIRELFFEYILQSLPPPTFEEEGDEIFAKTEMLQEGTPLSVNNDILDFDVDISDITCNQQMKSELDEYLDEPLLPRVQDFDVLGWWKLNRLKYPTLSKVASDVLSLPVSTVDPDSVFDTVSNKVVDGYRSSLKPATLEALICAKDWLQYESSEHWNAKL